MVDYSPLSSIDRDDDEVEISFNSKSANSVTDNQIYPTLTHETLFENSNDYSNCIRQTIPVPISRPPTKARDWVYGVFFVTHFIVILIISLFEKYSLHHALISYSRAGSWASIAMISTLLGALLGALVVVILMSSESKTSILSTGLIFSLVLKVVMGNIILLMSSSYHILGIILLLAAMWDFFHLSYARTGVGFSSTLLELVSKLSQSYGFSLALAVATFVAVQTCVLLWWGAFFVGAVSTLSPAVVLPVATVLLLSLHWIIYFFRSCISFLVGGCILWLFLSDDNEAIGSSRVFLYIRCCLSTSFGSVAKASLFFPFAQALTSIRYLAVQQRCRLCSESIIYERARMFQSLSIPLVAVYGRTLSRTAEDQLQRFPETLRCSMHETTGHSLACLAASISGIVSIFFSLLAEHGDKEETWPFLLFVCFFLTYGGTSLTLSVYSAGIDSLIIAAVLNPAKLAQYNQIVLLRFLRTAEMNDIENAT